MGSASTSQNWSNDFDLIIRSETNPNRAILKHKIDQSRYQLLTIYATDDNEMQSMIKRLKKREQIKSKYIVPFEKIYHKNQDNICSNYLLLDLIYQNSETTLADHFNHRKMKQQNFTPEEIMYIINNICLALKDIKVMEDQHGKITLQNVIVTQQVMLSDPIVVETKDSESTYSKNKIIGYPSPTILFNHFDQGMKIDRFKQDLFSLGIVVLQLLNKNINMKSIYKSKSKSYENQKIDFDLISSLLKAIPYHPLQEWIYILLHPNSDQRINIYQLISNLNLNKNTIKLFTENLKVITAKQELIEITKPPNLKSYLNQIHYPRPELAISSHLTHQIPSVQQHPQSFHKNITFTGSPPLESVRPHLAHSTFIPQAKSEQLIPHNTTFVNRNVTFGGSKPQNSIHFVHPKPIEPRIINAYYQFNNVKNEKSKFEPQHSSTHNFHYQINSKPEEPQQNFTSSRQTFSPASEKPNTYLHQGNSYNNGLDPKNLAKIIQKPTHQHYRQNNQKNKIILAKNQKQKTPNKNLLSLQQQFLQLQALTNKNSLLLLQKQMNKQGNNFVDTNLTPTGQEEIMEVTQEDSKIEQPSFVMEEYEDGTKYEGYIVDKKRNGYGKCYYRGGSIYDGEWKNNIMNGYGTLYYPEGRIAYQGYWKNDQFCGTGTIFNDHVQPIKGEFDYTNFQLLQLDQWQYYEGDCLNSKKHGKGKLILANGQNYLGQFFMDIPHGSGIFTQGRGNKIKGIWSDGILKTLLD